MKKGARIPCIARLLNLHTHLEKIKTTRSIQLIPIENVWVATYFIFIHKLILLSFLLFDRNRFG